MMNGRFFPKLESMAKGDLSDELYTIAHNIENTLLQSGAVAGEDYSRLEVMKMASPYVLAMFNDGDRIEFTYPAENIL